jgi:uncharacterized protein YccT (UPF0319 family)
MTNFQSSVKLKLNKGANMRKLMFLSSAVALLFSVSSVAENIHFPEEFVPLQVGERIIESSLFSRVDDLELAPGTYQLRLKYTDLYEDDYDTHEVVESEPFWVDVTIEAGKNYTLVFNRASNAISAKAFAQAPEVSLKTKDNPLAVPLETISNSELASAMPAKLAAAHQTSRLKPQVIKPIAPINGKGMPSAADMLDFWWQQATPAQQKAFLEKVTK